VAFFCWLVRRERRLCAFRVGFEGLRVLAQPRPAACRRIPPSPPRLKKKTTARWLFSFVGFFDEKRACAHPVDRRVSQAGATACVHANDCRSGNLAVFFRVFQVVAQFNPLRSSNIPHLIPTQKIRQGRSGT